jgi:bifunctional ADP-heptose synthase (sugar kinase/adenylyltransferase)
MARLLHWNRVRHFYNRAELVKQRTLRNRVVPDILIKGADWAHFIAGREEVEAAGGKVMTVALEPAYSTTNIVEMLLGQP